MKIYLSHSSSFDFEDQLYKPLKDSLLIKSHQFFFAHDKENIDTKSKEIIQNSDLVIAEVSYPSTGQGIELGWADIQKIPVLCLYSSGSTFSNSLKFVLKLG